MELFVEKLVPGGLGLARTGEGQVVLIPGVLPGERVLAEPGERLRGVWRARVAEVLEAAPYRREPDCPLAGRCGGCDFLHVDPGRALELKSRAALGELADGLGLPLELIESPTRERYRIRATLHLGRRPDGSWGVGFYDARRQLVEPAECRLLAPELTGLMLALRAWAAGAAIPAAAEISLMRGAAGPGQMVVVTPAIPPLVGGRRGRPRPAPPASGWERALDNLPALLADQALPEAAVFLRAGAGPVRRLSPAGPDRIPAAVWPAWGLTLRAAPGGFTQVNPGVSQRLVETILDLAAPLAPGRALDLYAGLGNIGLPLARSGFAVTAVEEAPAGARAARENGGGVPGFTVIQDSSEKALVQLARQSRTFDLVVLDPPRAGARDLAPAAAALKPRLIVYVACHPAVLGRDLPAFVSLGYQPRRLVALDMFPRTSHLEAVVALQRG